MNKEANLNELEMEKKQIEALFAEESLSHYNHRIQEVPHGYFEQFPSKLMDQIAIQKKPAPIFNIAQLAVAAAILLVVVGSAVLIQKPNLTLQENRIALQEISSSELDSYVNNNEWVTEIELQNEINNLGLNLETNKLSNDSSN